MNTEVDARIRESRMALARDLHDSIGHSLTMAALYAQVAAEARRAGHSDVEAWELVGRSVSDALRQLRATVASLRDPELSGHAPGETLAAITRLAAAPRAAGYQVELDIDVADLAPPPEVAAAAFRVVQEAITNTVRHSCGDRIVVTVRQHAADTLLVVVSDNGRVAGAPDLSGGHGLRGMRERLSALGASLQVRAGTDGWRVRAVLPLRGDDGLSTLSTPSSCHARKELRHETGDETDQGPGEETTHHHTQPDDAALDGCRHIALEVPAESRQGATEGGVEHQVVTDAQGTAVEHPDDDERQDRRGHATPERSSDPDHWRAEGQQGRHPGRHLDPKVVDQHARHGQGGQSQQRPPGQSQRAPVIDGSDFPHISTLRTPTPTR